MRRTFPAALVAAAGDDHTATREGKTVTEYADAIRTLQKHATTVWRQQRDAADRVKELEVSIRDAQQELDHLRKAADGSYIRGIVRAIEALGGTWDPPEGKAV